jgi:predicted TIM-barrel fold metal-dependent hydrolase
MQVSPTGTAIAEALPLDAFMWGSIFPVIGVYERLLTASP